MTSTPTKTGRLITDEATGAAAIAHSYTVERACRLISVTLKLSAAPTTSGAYTITVDKNAGAVYDTLEYTVDLAAGGTTSVDWKPDSDMWLEPGDAVDVVYANANTKTYGSQITVKESF